MKKEIVMVLMLILLDYQLLKEQQQKKNHAKDLNIGERISLFKNQLKMNLFIKSLSDIFQILEKLIFRQKSTIE